MSVLVMVVATTTEAKPLSIEASEFTLNASNILLYEFSNFISNIKHAKVK